MAKDLNKNLLYLPYLICPLCKEKLSTSDVIINIETTHNAEEPMIDVRCCDKCGLKIKTAVIRAINDISDDSRIVKRWDGGE